MANPAEKRASVTRKNAAVPRSICVPINGLAGGSHPDFEMAVGAGVATGE